MAFEYKNLIQLSAGETSPDQLGGQKLMSYESETDLVIDMTAPGYFDSIAKLVRFGSLFILTDYTNYSDVFQVTTLNPTNNPDTVDLELFALPTPASGIYYETLAETVAEFTTSGGITDVYNDPSISDTLATSVANFSLNSQVTDIAPPFAHAGIEHVACQPGQVEIFWSRPVLPGQSVKMWLQIRSGDPTPAP